MSQLKKNLLQQINRINPKTYAKTRNFLDGDITKLSPYITHGFIKTTTIRDIVLQQYSWTDAEKLISELAWREFFHRVWADKQDEIFDDLRFDQTKVAHYQLPTNIVKATTKINAIDNAINKLYNTGYLHNHERMWLASIICNIAKTTWYPPAKWLYYHLLDGDLASNTLSWQWIAGTFSSKKYYANQENINKYSRTKQRNTFVDINYEQFELLPVPAELHDRTETELKTTLPPSTLTQIPADTKHVFLRSIWNLDPDWYADKDGLQILVFEPSHFRKWPISSKRIDFILELAAQIPEVEIFVGEIATLFPAEKINELTIITESYPTTTHWPGLHENRAWLFPEVQGYYKNFFSFWKDAKKSIGKK
jgi:deoxyribodipyrimidine photo-lyase